MVRGASRSTPQKRSDVRKDLRELEARNAECRRADIPAVLWRNDNAACASRGRGTSERIISARLSGAEVQWTCPLVSPVPWFQKRDLRRLAAPEVFRKYYIWNI